MPPMRLVLLDFENRTLRATVIKPMTHTNLWSATWVWSLGRIREYGEEGWGWKEYD